jgi:uncharacterized lipoprotein YddW (UPF0748 family)
MSQTKTIFIILTLTLLSILSPLSNAQSVTNANPKGFKGVWITKYDIFDFKTPQDLQNAVNRLISFGFTDIYLDIDPGCMVFPSDFNYKGKNYNFNCTDSRIAKRNYVQEFLAMQDKINVCGWIQYGYMVNPEFNKLYTDNEELKMKNQKGEETDAKGHRWINPLHPGTVAFMNDRIKDILQNYSNLKCLQFDDHFGFNYEMGYDDYTKNKYKSQTGRNVPNNNKDYNFTKWRNDQLSFNNNSIIKNTRALRNNIKISISPNPFSFSYWEYMQDIEQWVENKMADELIFQVYRNNGFRFWWDINDGDMKKIAKKVPTYIGLAMVVNGKPLENSVLEDMVKTIKGTGYKGKAYFYYKTTTTDLSGKVGNYRDTLLKL